MLSSVTLNCQVNKDCHEFRFSIVKNVSQMSQVSKIALWRCSLNVFFIVIVFVLVFVIVFFGQVMSSHHSYPMSQRSQVSRFALWRCSLNVFVFGIVFVFVFVIFIGQVMSPHHSDQMSQRSQVWSQDRHLKMFCKCICLCHCHCLCHCLCHGLFFIRSCPLITLIKCLKCHKSLGSLSEGVLKMYLSLSSSLCLSLYLLLSFFWSGHVPSSLWSSVSKVTSL